MQSLTLLEGAALTPYVGVRSYGANEAHIFTGRELDIAQVGNLVANRARWRIILLHGQTGCGKSSFLKAGLIPEITSPSFETTVYDRSEDKSYSRFITSSADPMARLAGVAVDLLREHVPASEQGAWCDALGLSQDLSLAERALSDSAPLLARWFAALAPQLNRPLLLVIDQAEELFTLGVDDEALQARSEYFDFLAMHGERSSWIQLLISMRTEFYGRFDHELRCRLGASMPVAPYYLEAFSALTLMNAVTEPLNRTFHTEDGMAYTLHFEPALPERIANAVISGFPGPGALTCLQIVCTRLWQQALEGVRRMPAIAQEAPRELWVTHAMYTALGPLKNVLEDIVDQAIGDFCEQESMVISDSMRVWRHAKQALTSLVSQQTGGAPSTIFMLREQFVNDLVLRLKGEGSGPFEAFARSMRLIQLPNDLRPLAQRLVDHLLRSEVRVLREIAVSEPGHTLPSRYVALGHDVLTVGMAEAATRKKRIDDRLAKENRSVLWRMFAAPLVLGALGAATPYLATQFGATGLEPTLINVVNWGLLSLIGGFYLMIVVEAFRSQPIPGMRGWGAVVKDHLNQHVLSSSEPDMVLDAAVTLKPPASLANFLDVLTGTFIVLRHARQPMSATGQLFQALTADARHEAAIQGTSAFPGQPRY